MTHPTITPAQAERLQMLIEECGEVVQACTKILRHGWENRNPYEGTRGMTNVEHLVKELTDVSSVVTMIAHAEDIAFFNQSRWPKGYQPVGYSEKLKWTHHQSDLTAHGVMLPNRED